MYEKYLAIKISAWFPLTGEKACEVENLSIYIADALGSLRDQGTAYVEKASQVEAHPETIEAYGRDSIGFVEIERVKKEEINWT